MKLTITKTGKLSKCVLDAGENSVVLPESVTSISAKAFEKCGAQIEKITLPATLKAADEGAFRPLTALKEAVVSEGAEMIPEYLFQGCATLEKVALPSTLKTIGLCAFRKCSALRQIELPDSIIDMNSFYGCTSLTEIRIPAGLKEVRGFGGCTSLRSVTLGEGVISLGREAFKDCTALDQIELPKSLTCLAISAFYHCTALREIVLPEGVTGIGDMCFAGCTALEKAVLPSSLTRIGMQAFVNCVQLREIAIPEKVDFFAEINASYAKLGIFGGCEKLEMVSMSPLQAKVLFKATAAALKKAALPYKAEKDAQAMFEECPLVKEIALIEKQSDEWSDGTCDFVNEADGVRLIRCLKPGILEYTVPDDVTVIADDAFAQNNRLKRFYPNALISRINLRQFAHCRMAELTLSDNVTEVAGDDFSALASPDQYGRDVWAKLNVSDTHPTYAVSDSMIFKKKDGQVDTLLVNMELVRWQPLVIPQGVVNIAPKACAGGKYSEVELPEGLRVIGASAFNDNRNLAKISLPDGLEEIGEKAFGGCRSLMELDIPDSVTTIGKGALLAKVVVICTKGSAAEAYAQKAGMDIRYREGAQENAASTDPNDMSALFTWTAKKEAHILGGFVGGVDEVYVPAEKDGIKVEGYDSKLFSRVKKTMKIVHLPEGMTEIPAKLFSQCNALEEVHLPSTLTEIGEGAFMGCTNLYRVEIPESVTEIGGNLFGSTWEAQAHIPNVVLSGASGGVVQETAKNLGCRFVDANADEETRKIQERFSYCRDDRGNVIITAIYTLDEPETVEIPERIEGNKVVALKCDGVVDVPHLKIPASLHVIEASLSYVKTLEVDPKNRYILQEGLLWYRKQGREVGGLLSGAKSLPEIVVREGTETIDSSIFGFGAWVKRLVLPASIRNAGYLYGWEHVITKDGVVIGHRSTAAEDMARASKIALEYVDDSDEVRAIREIFPTCPREDGTLALLGYRGNDSHVVIPEEIGGQSVSTILRWCDPSDANFPKSVYIPASIKLIEEVYLAECEVEVSEDNTVFVGEDGKLYERGEDRLMFCPPAAPLNSFRAGMREIGGRAMAKLHIEEFRIPEGVEKVTLGDKNCDVEIGRLVLSKSVRELNIALWGKAKIFHIAMYPHHCERIYRMGTFDSVSFIGTDGKELCTLTYAGLMVASTRDTSAIENLIAAHDAAFEKIKDADMKILTALYRLEKPYALTDELCEKMTAYLRRQAKRAGSTVIEKNNIDLLRVLLEQGIITKKNVGPLLELCGEQGRIEMSALLLEYTQGER